MYIININVSYIFYTTTQHDNGDYSFLFRYRNTYKHNLCVDMLQNGYHHSFCELFALIKSQEDDRMEAGPESIQWSQQMLKDQHDKLDMLKLHLTRAEDARRKGNKRQLIPSLC